MKYRRRQVIRMDNQYNYYNQNNTNGNYQYGGGEPYSDGSGKKPKKKMPKAVAVTGLALLFGAVSSAAFLTSNIIGSRILGLNSPSQSSTEGARTVSSNASLSQTSSVVTSDV